MCLAQGHIVVTQVRLDPAAPRSGVKHSSTEPLCSLSLGSENMIIIGASSQDFGTYPIYSRTSMARILMAHSPGSARTIIMVPTGQFMHNQPWMAGTTFG